MNEETRSRHDEDHEEIPRLKKQVGRILSDRESEKATQERANSRIEERVRSIEVNGREIGEISTKVDGLVSSFEEFRAEIRRGRDEDKKWRDLHDGQGTGTTHSQMWTAINGAKSEAEKANNGVANIKTNASVLAAVIGVVTSFLSSMGINLWGPK